MSVPGINRRIFLNTLNRLREQLFDNESLRLFGIEPETGESQLVVLSSDWSGRRVVSAADGEQESGFWQFQIAAGDDWQTTQLWMLKTVSLKIGERRWKVKKVEKPVGNAKVWKIKAEIQ